MAIYVSTICLGNENNVFRVLETYTKAGLRNIELNAAPTVTSFEYIDDLPPIKFKQYNFNFIVHHLFPPLKEPFTSNLASQNPVILKRSKDQIKRSIEFCHSLGIGLFTFHGGFRFDPDNKRRFCENEVITPEDQAITLYERAFITLIESIDEINSYAQQMGVRVAIENRPLDRRRRFPMPCEAEEIERLLQKIPSPNLGTLVDLGHVKVTSHWLNRDKYDFIDKVKNRVFAFHIHENNGYADEHKKLDETSWCFEVIGRKCFIGLPVILETAKPKLTINEITQQVSLIEKILGEMR